MNVHHGMNRADLDRLLISLGGSVDHLRRTGEVVYSHPAIRSRPRANGRRKDAPRHLTSFVRKAAIVAALLTTSSAATAGICDYVQQAASVAGASAAAAGVGAQASLTAGSLTAVLHSSGSYILTGSSGYVANTLGFAAGAWAVMTSPITLTLTAALAAAGAGTVVACHYGSTSVLQ